uniref:Cation channel sperm-associated protein 1 n=1 Tax=Sus scrofa TaxID=9823 RepID=A0A480IKL5_PIG
MFCFWLLLLLGLARMPGPGGEEGTQGQSRTLARLMHACTHTLEVHRYTLPSLCPGPAVRTQNRLGFENSVGAQACRPNDLSSRSGDLSRPTRWAGADVWTQTLLEGHFLKSSSPASKAVSTISSMTEAWERNFCWYCSTPATSCRKWNRSSCCLSVKLPNFFSMSCFCMVCSLITSSGSPASLSPGL